MGVSKKGKRKIMIDGNVYWWFAEAGAGGEPVCSIYAQIHRGVNPNRNFR